MTAFITVALDDGGGTVILNVSDIQSIGAAQGEARGARIVMRRGNVLNVKDTYECLLAALHGAGVMRD